MWEESPASATPLSFVLRGHSEEVWRQWQSLSVSLLRTRYFLGVVAGAATSGDVYSSFEKRGRAREGTEWGGLERRATGNRWRAAVCWGGRVCVVRGPDSPRPEHGFVLP